MSIVHTEIHKAPEGKEWLLILRNTSGRTVLTAAFKTKRAAKVLSDAMQSMH